MSNKCHLSFFASQEQYNEWLRCPLEDRVLDFINYHCGTTFAELHSWFKQEFEGDQTCMIVGQNIIFWMDMSKEFIEVIQNLLKGKKIDAHGYPSNVMCYLMDGECLRLPIARRPNHYYMKPHWMPLTFSSKR